MILLILATVCFPTLAGAVTYGFEALIDGRDQLRINRNTLQWHHFDFAAVGRHEGANAPTIIISNVNGVESSANWLPDWPLPPPNEIRFEAFSSVFTDLTPAFPTNGVDWRLTKLFGRGETDIIQQPRAVNDFTLVIEFNDNLPGGSRFYGIEIAQVPEPSTFLLFGSGLGGVAAWRWRKAKGSKS